MSTTETPRPTFADLVRAEFERAAKAGETWPRDLDPELVPLINPERPS